MARVTPNKNDVQTLNNKPPLRTRTNGQAKEERDIRIYDLYKRCGYSIPKIAAMFYPVINPIFKDVPEPNVEKYYRMVEDIIQRQIELEQLGEAQTQDIERCETDDDTEEKNTNRRGNSKSRKSASGQAKPEGKTARATKPKRVRE